LRINSKAIALSSLNYGDNSLISKVYSKEFGFISLISSARKNKKQGLKHYFDPLNCIQLSFYYRANKDLHRLTEVSNAAKRIGNESTIETIKKSSLRFFLAELLGKILTQTEKDDLLFEFLWKKSEELLTAEDIDSNFHLLFMWELCDILGISPVLSTEGEFFDHEEASFVIRRPRHKSFEGSEVKLLLMQLKEDGQLNQVQRQSLIRFFLRYFEFQFGGLGKLKTLDVLESVFS